MAKTWLLKEEPTHYSFDDLVKEGHTRWEGVKNPLAQKNLRQIRKGDRILYYHTGKEKAIVGIARAASDAYPDAKKGERFAIVDVEPVERLPRPVPLADVKKNPNFKEFALVRLPRLSVMPVTAEQWTRLEQMSRGA